MDFDFSQSEYNFKIEYYEKVYHLRNRSLHVLNE